MAFQAPLPRDDAAWEKRFDNIKFDSDDPECGDAFHNFKSRYELSLKASRTMLLTSPKPAVAAHDPTAGAAVIAAARHDVDKWEHYQPLFHNCLSNSVIGSQLSTIIIPAQSGHDAWTALCDKNESKHTITAVSLIYRLISIIMWDGNQDPDPRWAVAELTKISTRLSELTHPIKVDDTFLQAILLGRFMNHEPSRSFSQALMSRHGLTYAQTQTELEGFYESEKSRMEYTNPETRSPEQSSSKPIAKSASSGPQTPGNRKQCTNCGKIGHEHADCFSPGGGSEDAKKLAELIKKNAERNAERKKKKEAEEQRKKDAEKAAEKAKKARKSRSRRRSRRSPSPSTSQSSSTSSSSSSPEYATRRSSRHRSRISRRSSLAKVKSPVAKQAMITPRGHLAPVHKWWVDLPSKNEFKMNLDSGCTATMKKTPKHVANYHKYARPDKCDTAKEGSQIDIIGDGLLSNLVPNAVSPCKLEVQTLVTPDADEDLLSASQTVDMPAVKKVELMNDDDNTQNDSWIHLHDGNKIPIDREHGSYYVRFKMVKGNLPHAAAAKSTLCASTPPAEQSADRGDAAIGCDSEPTLPETTGRSSAQRSCGSSTTCIPCPE